MSNPISKEDFDLAGGLSEAFSQRVDRVKAIAQALADRGATAKAKGRREAFGEAVRIAISSGSADQIIDAIRAARDRETP